MKTADDYTRQQKADYVRSQRGPHRLHECHWPGCPTQVHPAKWGCLKHWRRLPKSLQEKIWATFRPGQEKNWTPSRAYVQVAKEVQLWISIEESGL